jgi:hypothetical protein
MDDTLPMYVDPYGYFNECEGKEFSFLTTLNIIGRSLCNRNIINLYEDTSVQYVLAKHRSILTTVYFE